GSNDTVLAMGGRSTRMLDLDGRTVLPGFVDAHAHMDREGLRHVYPNLQACRSIADVQAVVRRAAAERAPGEWIVLLPLGDPPSPSAADLTVGGGRSPARSAPRQPAPETRCWPRSLGGYGTHPPPFVPVLNSAALAACGIGADTPPPASTVALERDAQGTL